MTATQPVFFPLPQDAEYWIRSRSCAYAYDTWFVSNLEESDIAQSVKMLAQWMGDTVLAQPVHFPHETVDMQPHATQFFDGGVTLRADSISRTMKGMYLRIIFAYQSKDQIGYVEQYVTHAVNLLRLKYGLCAALDCAKIIEWDLTTRKPSFPSMNGIYAATVGNGREGNPFYEHGRAAGITSVEEIELESDASALFNEALIFHNKHHRFLLLWMALEAQLGGGRARKAFCEKNLKSEKISLEMHRMHKIRSNYAHTLEAVPQNQLPIETLMEFLRLSTLGDCPERAALVKIVEDSIPDS